MKKPKGYYQAAQNAAWHVYRIHIEAESRGFLFRLLEKTYDDPDYGKKLSELEDILQEISDTYAVLPEEVQLLLNECVERYSEEHMANTMAYWLR